MTARDLWQFASAHHAEDLDIRLAGLYADGRSYSLPLDFAAIVATPSGPCIELAENPDPWNTEPGFDEAEAAADAAGAGTAGAGKGAASESGAGPSPEFSAEIHASGDPFDQIFPEIPAAHSGKGVTSGPRRLQAATGAF